MPKRTVIFFCLLSLFVGLLLGGFLFKDTRPRSFLALPDCGSTCLKRSELAGIAASIGIRFVPGLIPDVILETEKSVAFQSPDPLARIDYLIVPKKDIRDLGDLSTEDAEYVKDAFQVISQLVRDNKLHRYKVIANGPGFQQLNYLHFHVVAE